MVVIVVYSYFFCFQGRFDNGFSSLWERKGVDMESIVLLLKCFKIMENATFMSSDNQVMKAIP